MPLLFPNLRISQVFGDVGKTLLTTALVRSSALRYRGAGEASSNTGYQSKRVFYLKPVSTGPDSESDVSYVDRHTRSLSDTIATHNLYQYREPMSPHLAAQLAPDLPFPKTNQELVNRVSRYAQRCAEQLGDAQGALYVETAGGVHSPSIHSTHTQSTSLLPLRLPSVLIAAPQLGGISTTLSSYESLHLRGYHISAVLCLEHDYYRNHEFLKDYFAEKGIKFWSLPPPPEKNATLEEDAARLGLWYKSIEAEGAAADQAAAWLDQEHRERITKLQGMPDRTLSSVWWPFTQHGLVNKPEDVMVIDSAEGDYFDAYYARPAASSSSGSPTDHAQPPASLLNPYFDGAASWFTQSHGHAATPLTLAAAHAAGRYGHVLFPSGTHEPALHLAEKLKETAGKGWADRVFYSDNGSTGTEVALKMAMRAAGRRYGWTGDEGDKVGVIGLRGGYHGDTIGSMDASEPSTFNKAVDWYKGRGHWFSPPIVQFRGGKPTVSTTGPDTWPTPPPSCSASIESTQTDHTGWISTFSSVHEIYDVASRSSSPLADYYRHHIRSTLETLVKEGRKFGAVMMEPTCLGAGGMLFVDPLFQACLVEVVRASGDLFGGDKWVGKGYDNDIGAIHKRAADEWQGLPIIYDEVFSGLHRFGYHTASSVLSHTPDISVYAKILTGGLLPLSATLASRSIFEAFLSDKKVDALLHGHSYTANPIGCAVALEAVNMVDRHEKAGGWNKERAMWNANVANVQQQSMSRLGDQEGKVQEARWSFWSPDFVERVSRLKGVQGVMALGTVCAIELKDAEGGYSSHKALDFLTQLRTSPVRPSLASSNLDNTDTPVTFTDFAIHSRPLGNVLYFMTSLFTEPDIVRAMEERIEQQLHSL